MAGATKRSGFRITYLLTGVTLLATVVAYFYGSWAAARREELAQQAAAHRARSEAAAGPRPLPVRLARAVLPDVVRVWLRSTLRPKRSATPPPLSRPRPPAELQPLPEPPPNLEAFLRFTVDDLEYRTTDLDRSMDLLANDVMPKLDHLKAAPA